MGRGLFKPWWALAALLLVTAVAASPAEAQVRPYPSRGTYISSPPKHFCSEAERQAYLARAEEARTLIEADADRARAYFIGLRQSAAAAANDAARQAFMRLLREFEHGDEDATTGDGPLHWMTVTEPGEIDAKIAAAKAAPLIDCSSLEALERMRPQLDPLQLPALPARLCSEEEREAVRRRLRETIDAAKAQIERTTRYLGEMSGHDGLGWTVPQSPERDLHLANLRAERSWALDRNLANSRLQYQAEQREKALDAMPIVPCDGPTEVGAVPAASPGPVPARPPLPAGPAPIPTTPLCTEADRRARIELIDAAIRAADARLVLANTHITALGVLSETVTRAKADFYTIQQINEEVRSYQIVVHALKLASDLLRVQRRDAIARPLDPCPPPAPPAEGVVPGTPAQPGDPRAPGKPAATPGGGKKACPGKKRAGRAPISIGSNGRVGSGARAKKKLASTLGGLAGGLLGGGGGGGGGKSGPPLAKCKIKNSEKTVFTDPATGIALRVGARRSGDTVTVFADVAKSPDSGTFQGGWVETPDGELVAPARADICALWGEWSLTVSWTRETYVDGNLVSRETGGFNEGGAFSLPGMLSSDARPAGLWRQLGFSNASHGAREVALRYPIAQGAGEPLRLLLHVTRPSRDPVDTQPFELVMTEGPGGFSFAEAPPDEPCVPDPPEAAPDSTAAS